MVHAARAAMEAQQLCVLQPRVAAAKPLYSQPLSGDISSQQGIIMKKRVFYSWQSDLPNSTNRSFINSAIEKAITEITSDETFTLIPFLDRDTAGLAGSPDIAASIFDKINQSSVFICDLSIVNGISEEYRSTPNPNVLIELGYAISELGWDKIILIMNEVYGGIDLLPFDLRGRRILSYKITSDAEHKTDERKKVVSILKNGIREILINLDKREDVKLNAEELTVQNQNSLQIDKEAESRLNVIKSITFIQNKNNALVEATNKYIGIGRYDLAVLFALEITYIQQKNDFLIYIAGVSLKNKDIQTAEKAVSGITYIQPRNDLSMQILKMMG